MLDNGKDTRDVKLMCFLCAETWLADYKDGQLADLSYPKMEKGRLENSETSQSTQRGQQVRETAN
eukprot:727427-Amphidinium_carterae.1